MAARALSLILVLACPVLTAAAQTFNTPDERHSFVHQAWTVEDGLPVNHVNQLYQTPDGYLWMATFDGLVRFDGVRFTVYNAANTPGLPSNRLVTIQPGQDNSFWLTTEQNHLIRFDQGSIRSHLSGRVFHRARVFLDGDSAVFISTREGAFREMDGQLVPLVRDVLGNAPVRDFLRLTAGDLWVATSRGAVRLGVGEASIYHVPAMGPGGVRRLAEGSDGTIWAAGAGIARFVDGAFEAIVNEEAPWAGEDPPSIFALREDSRGRTMISSARGLFVLDAGDVHPLGSDAEWQPWGTALQQGGAFATCPDGFLWAVDRGRLYRDGDFVFDTELHSGTLLCDNEGNLWVTTFSEGLHRFRPALITAIGARDQFPPFNVYGVFEDRRGTMWFGSTTVASTLMADGHIEPHRSPDFDGPVAAILDAADGALWVGRHRCSHDRRTEDGRCSRFEIEPVLPPGVYAVVQRRDGSLWFGTNMGIFRRRGDEWTHFTMDDGLPHLFVRFFLEARDGTLWMSTNGGGIAQFVETGPSRGTFRAVTRADGLPSNNVRGLYEDRHGAIWIATEDRGLARLDPQTGAVATMTQANGLYRDGLHAILEDDDGRLWMSTNSGLFWVAVDELRAFVDGHAERVRSTFYTERDGMRNREANGGFQNAALKARDGRLWFATQNGAVVVDPRDIGTTIPAAPVIIEELRTSTGMVYSVEGEPVNLSARERSFSVRYSSPSFSAPERLRFRYRLEGFDEDWVDVEHRREAVYTRVPPGAYALHVSASADNETWNDVRLPLALTVAPFFYETRWFILLCVLAGLGVVAGIYEYRLFEIRRRERKLRAVVDARTRELRVANARMEDQARQLRDLDQAKSRFFADISHEFRTPLTMTIGPLQDLRDGRFGMIEPRAREQLDIALRNGRRLHRLTNQLLDLARLEAGQFMIQRRPGDLASYVRTLSGPFRAAAERAGIMLTAQLPEQPVVVSFDPEHLDKVFANLLSNALKFTAAGGDVLLRLEVVQHQAVVSVRDTGTGISEEHLPHVFERFFQGQKSEMQPGTGIGLSLAWQIAELHEATLEVSSTVGVGSTFTVRLPLETTPAHVASHLDRRSAGASAVREATTETNEATATSDEQQGDVTTVLIVDDNADIRAYVRSHLAGQYMTVEAADGENALTALGTHLPDLIISDVMMPRMDGFKLLETLRSDPETDFIPIILLTARAEAEDRLAGLGLGADDYITKPFDARELSARVDNLIAQRRRLKNRYALARDGGEDAGAIHPAPSEAMSADAAFLERVRTVIERSMDDEDFGVEAMALAVGQSRSSLHRHLSNITGESPSHLLRRMRLERGADLLRRRAGTVSEIAYAVGFKSVAHFSTSFRQHFDQTPTAYQTTSRSAETSP